MGNSKSVNVGFFVVGPGHQGVWLGAEKARQCREHNYLGAARFGAGANAQKRLRDIAMRLVRASRVSQSTQCAVGPKGLSEYRKSLGCKP